MGLAAAHASRGLALAAVHMGCPATIEHWGHFVSPASLVWHPKTKAVGRIGITHRWARDHHCTLPIARLDCLPARWAACDGGRVRLCNHVYNTSTCRTDAHNLLPRRRIGTPRGAQPGCFPAQETVT